MPTPTPEENFSTGSNKSVGVQGALRKYGIVGVITTVMFLVGVLCNTLSDKNPQLVPHPEWCHHSRLYTSHQEKIANMTKMVTTAAATTTTPGPTTVASTLQQQSLYIPTMPRGLATTTAVFCFLWPLLPMLLNSRKSLNEAKIESIMSHVLGQTSNFGIAEVFRTQIPYPEDLFLDKCNLSPEECLRMSREKRAMPLYLPPSADTTDSAAMCKGQFYNMHLQPSAELSEEDAANVTTTPRLPRLRHSFKDEAIIYNSLHHYPDPVCMLFGSALVSFIATIMHWRRLNPTQKKLKETSATVRSILTISDIAMMSCGLFYVYNLYIAYDMSQTLGIFVGILLQVMINRTVAYKHREAQQQQQQQRDGTTAEGLPLSTL